MKWTVLSSTDSTKDPFVRSIVVYGQLPREVSPEEATAIQQELVNVLFADPGATTSYQDLPALARFDFGHPDLEAFPCLALAYRALRAGGGAPAVLNAANEVAVSAFLQGRLGFLGIPALVQAVLDAQPAGSADDLAQLLATDAAARRTAETLVPRMQRQ